MQENLGFLVEAILGITESHNLLDLRELTAEGTLFGNTPYFIFY